MNVDEIINKNKLLEEELQKTKEELINTKEHLKKYTSPVKNKKYYEENKNDWLARANEHSKANYGQRLARELNQNKIVFENMRATTIEKWGIKYDAKNKIYIASV